MNTLLPIYKGEQDITLLTLEKLKGHALVSRQFIADLLNADHLVQAEREIIQKVLAEYSGDQVQVQDFCCKVKNELFQLTRIDLQKQLSPDSEGQRPRYQRITLPPLVRGSVKEYHEIIYSSPFKNSAGDVHFDIQIKNSGADHYFAHTRVEDLTDDTTRRIIEIQSDLFQKGGLQNHVIGEVMPMAWDIAIAEMRKEMFPGKTNDDLTEDQIDKVAQKTVQRRSEITKKALPKLEPYRNTWFERIIREEIRYAAQDRKSKLLFPTGTTAMQIEGLVDTQAWSSKPEGGPYVIDEEWMRDRGVGTLIYRGAEEWIIADIFGGGKFKAVPHDILERHMQYIVTNEKFAYLKKRAEAILNGEQATVKDIEAFVDKSLYETFDISGRTDTDNRIYRFYEKDISRYLTKFGAKRIIDDRGVNWIEVPIPKEYADMPILAFSSSDAIQQSLQPTMHEQRMEELKNLSKNKQQQYER